MPRYRDPGKLADYNGVCACGGFIRRNRSRIVELLVPLFPEGFFYDPARGKWRATTGDYEPDFLRPSRWAHARCGNRINSTGSLEDQRVVAAERAQAYRQEKAQALEWHRESMDRTRRSMKRHIANARQRTTP